MKKVAMKLLSGVLVFTILLSTAGCSKEVSDSTDSGQADTAVGTDGSDSKETIKVGLSVISLSDAVVAQMVSDMKEAAKEMNIELSVSDANNDPSAQISGVQNLVSAGCDAVIIQALDADAMAPIAKDAMEKGIKVIAYGIELEYYDCWYKNDNYLVGQTIGEMAADWINENCDGKAKVALIEYPTVSVLIDRSQGIEDALKEYAPDAQIVARGSAIDSESGMKLGETFLQQDSEIQVIVSISDGPALGAYEAIKVAGRDNDEFAIFGSDTSPIAVANILSGTCYRGTVDCDSKVSGRISLELAKKLVTGQECDEIVLMGANQVTIDNAKEFE